MSSTRIIMNRSVAFRVMFPDVSGLALHQRKTCMFFEIQRVISLVNDVEHRRFRRAVPLKPANEESCCKRMSYEVNSTDQNVSGYGLFSLHG